MSIKIIVTTIVAMGALAYAVSSHAVPAPDRDAVSVSLADLDLDSEAGASAALARINAAARSECAGRPAREFQACQKVTAARIVEGLHNPVITALSRGYDELATFLAGR